MRATINFSINADDGLLQRLRDCLDRTHGFANTGTAQWVKDPATATQVRAAVTDFWTIVGAHHGPATLDHFWMLVDT